MKTSYTEREDGQREDECKFKAIELVSKDVPRCLAEPPDIACEHADETGQKQTPPASLQVFVTKSEAYPKGEEAMKVVYVRCCGLDVHRDMVACVSIIEAGQRRKEIRTFRTITKKLLAMRQWLLSEGCSHVGMESTGVLWRPIYDRLSGYFELVLVNAAQYAAGTGAKDGCAGCRLACGRGSRTGCLPPALYQISPNKTCVT